MTTESKSVIIPCKELIPLGSGIAGLIALIGFLSFWAIIPERVNKLEISDREQSAEIRSIRDDNAQRREMLASIGATLAQINERTKRLEDHLIK
jgi:hypothetical protein